MLLLFDAALLEQGVNRRVITLVFGADHLAAIKLLAAFFGDVFARGHFALAFFSRGNA